MCVAHEQEQRGRENGTSGREDKPWNGETSARSVARSGARGAAKSGGATAGKRGLRVEIVDNWHRQWPDVRRSIDAMGHAQSLHVDDAGWLSARQVLLVAFDKSDAVAGHVCFSLSPRSAAGKITVEAHVDSFGVQPGFDRITLSGTLRAAAEKRAKALKCGRLVFDA
jgi:hypothetical protein